MKASLTACSLILALIMPSIGSASELAPLAGASYKLGTQNVSIYYTVDGDAYEVVTTIAPEYGTSGAPIRFVSLLRPGQTEKISVGSFDGAVAGATLELVHNGDLLSVTEKVQTAQLD